MIKNLGHIGLTVSDVTRSLEFYRDFLGMKVIMDLDITDDRMARVIGVPDAKCRIVHLQLGDGVLELFHYYQPAGENVASMMRLYDQGLSHIGFEVNDIHKHLKEIQERGGKLLGEPVEFRPGVWVAYFRGPDGEVCEIRQQPESQRTDENQ